MSYQRGNIAQLIDELGISVAQICKWRAQHREQSNPTSLAHISQEEQQEIEQLKKVLKNTQLELEILKEAIHIFPKRDGSITNL